ncbi:tetratricopeptide repeat protein [Granulicella tundricola]|uniref:TPR domain protein n=1 Tax=Granulicella tundricola (strain ATCC BAA-1859 / DSM 23138 / MP5ACTX9) TaxID=1198114 RepID=E8WZI4_GRATM|nr:tetratricopeptide repeat protein [Granulicella tundricola]ADW68872.1 TPR domain protein [Granulicella tundricola MP5ACTX9]
MNLIKNTLGCPILGPQSHRGTGWGIVCGSKRPLALAAALLFTLPFAKAQDFSSTTTHTIQLPENPARAAAQAALEARDYPKALKLLTPLAAANPGDAHLQYDLGSVQDVLDQSSPAEASYRAAINADQAFLEPHLALGLLLARAGRFDDARPELVAATKATGENLLKARAFRTLARLDEKSRPADARDELLEALKLSPETPEDTLLTAELAQSAGNGAKPAEAAYRRLLAQHPNDPQATAALAHLLVQEKRPDEAEALLNQSLTANPGDPVLTAQLASLLTQQGKTAQALPLVEDLHKAHPDNPEITHLLASLETQSGNFAAAEPLYAALSNAAPNDGTLADAHADALIHLKRYAEAEKILTHAVTTPITYPTKEDLAASAGHLAFAASSNNDPQGCLQALQLRATVLPSSPTTLFLAAISLDKLHRIKQAQQAYKDFLAASNGSLPDQEFEAQHRLIALQHMH